MISQMHFFLSIRVNCFRVIFVCVKECTVNIRVLRYIIKSGDTKEALTNADTNTEAFYNITFILKIYVLHRKYSFPSKVH